MPRPLRTLLAAFALGAAGLAGACATDGADRGPAYVVVEPNAVINDRSFIRRISILDDDKLLIEEAPGRYYQVTLFPACVSFADMLTPVRIAETGIGIDRTTRFIVGERTCPVRSIDRVERVPPSERAPAAVEQGAQTQ